jgi:hypothetical protein
MLPVMGCSATISISIAWLRADSDVAALGWRLEELDGALAVLLQP